MRNRETLAVRQTDTASLGQAGVLMLCVAIGCEGGWIGSPERACTGTACESAGEGESETETEIGLTEEEWANLVAESCADWPCPEGETCGVGCMPTVDLCVGVTCGDGLSCVDGECVAGCFDSGPCPEGGCPEGTFCAAEQCLPLNPCDLPCAEGKACHIYCAPENPCEGVTCGDCEICIEGVCLANLCCNVECPPGQVCVNGTCVETCNNEGWEGEGETPCVSDCTGLGCGDTDNCGRMCYACPPGQYCNDGTCECAGEPCAGGCCDWGEACQDGDTCCSPSAWCTDSASCCASGYCNRGADGDSSNDTCCWTPEGFCEDSNACCSPGQYCFDDTNGPIADDECRTCSSYCGGACCALGQICLGGTTCCTPSCGAGDGCGTPNGCGGTCPGTCAPGYTCAGTGCIPTPCFPSCGCGEVCVLGECASLCSSGQALCGCTTCCDLGETCSAATSTCSPAIK